MQIEFLVFLPFDSDEHGKKPTAKQTKLKAGFERQQAAADKTKQTNPDSNATTGKPPAQETANNNKAAKKTGFAAAPSGPSAKSAREARKNVVRINLAIKVHAENDLSSSTKFFAASRTNLVLPRNAASRGKV